MFFQEVIQSQLTTRIENEVLKEKELVITKGDWKPKSALKNQLNAKNVIYWLIDVNNKELYVGMAENLTKRVTEKRPEILIGRIIDTIPYRLSLMRRCVMPLKKW